MSSGVAVGYSIKILLVLHLTLKSPTFVLGLLNSLCISCIFSDESRMLIKFFLNAQNYGYSNDTGNRTTSLVNARTASSANFLRVSFVHTYTQSL